MNYTKAELEALPPYASRIEKTLAADALAWREIAEKLADELGNLRPQCPCEKCNESRLAALAAYEKAVGK